MQATVQETDTGLAINVLRILLRLTQKDLAKAIGIGTSSISDWETGKVIPRDNSVERVLDGMKLDPTALLRTLEYIQEMRGAFEGRAGAYPRGTTPPDQLREPSGHSPIRNPKTRSEIDSMARTAQDFVRRLLETHFAVLESQGDGE